MQWDPMRVVWLHTPPPPRKIKKNKKANLKIIRKMKAKKKENKIQEKLPKLQQCSSQICDKI